MLGSAVDEVEVESQKCSKTIQTKLKRSLLSKGLPEGCRQKCMKSMVGIKKITSLKEDLSCNCQKVSIENYSSLKNILPSGYDYRVCSYHGDATGFKTMLRLPHLTVEKVKEWKSQFENNSFCLFRVCRTFPGSGRYNSFKTDYACQHNASRGMGKLATKKTGCKSELSITVKRVVKKSRSRDKHLPELPTTIFVRWYHNHPLDAIESMRFHDVSEDTMKEFVTMFNQGHSPASAYVCYRSKLMKECGESFDTVAKDRRILPEKQYVYRLFAKIKKKRETESSNGASGSVFEALCNRQQLDVILPAAGSSTRMGPACSLPKQFQKVLGTHLIAYTIACFHKIPWIRHIVLVVNPSQETFTLDLVRQYDWSKVRVCAGSHSRHRSIRNGVRSLKDDCGDSSVVIIHDGARPFVPEDIIEKVAGTAEKHGAAGVVRPLVSTVIKPDSENVLESTLTRSDYLNSEMPQAFQYGVISRAYEKCSDHDLEHGTECLLLALKYSDCRAHLVKGCPDLWKVTYAKDLFTMESIVKEKFTRVSIIRSTNKELEYLECLKSSLEGKQIKLCGSEKDSANTLICFVDFPSSSLPSTTFDWDCLKQASWQCNKLSWLERRLGLFVILVFLHAPPSNIHSHAGCTVSDTVMTSTSPPIKKVISESHLLLNQPTLVPNTVHSLPHQQQQIHLQQQHSHIQQQLSLPHLESMIISNPAPPPLPPSVLDPCGDGHNNSHLYSLTPSFSGHPQYLNNPVFHLSESYNTLDSCNNSNSHQHLHPLPHSRQHHHEHIIQQQQQLIMQPVQEMTRPSHPYTHSATVSSVLSNEQNFTELSVNPLKECNISRTVCDEEIEQQSGDTHWQLSSTQQVVGSLISNSDKDSRRDPVWSLFPVCQDYIQQLRQMLKKNSTCDVCITGILSTVDKDVTDKLVELVWNRSQVLDGQVLMML